ncbi:MAG: NifU family protein [Deltaproteobacteria bacterium]|nr:NifU family protein [Deltaproteobacteria bacterium]
MTDRADEVQRVVREVLGPLVAADGGKLYLVRLGPDEVALHLAGRFAGCPGNTLAVRRVVEPAVAAVAPELRVTVTSGALVPQGAQLVSS